MQKASIKKIPLIFLALCISFFLIRLNFSVAEVSSKNLKILGTYFFGKTEKSFGSFNDVQLALWAKENIEKKSYVLNYGGYYSNWFNLSGMKTVFSRRGVFSHPQDRAILSVLKKAEKGQHRLLSKLLQYDVKHIFISDQYRYVPVNPYLTSIYNHNGSQLYEVNTRDYGNDNLSIHVYDVSRIADLLRSSPSENKDIKIIKIPKKRIKHFIVREVNSRSGRKQEYVRFNQGVQISKGALSIPLKAPKSGANARLFIALSEGDFEIQLQNAAKRVLFSKNLTSAHRAQYEFELESEALQHATTILIKNVGTDPVMTWGFMLMI